MRPDRQDRQAAILLLLATGAAAFLMLHHPTSLDGPDDGHLLGDWSNTAVHGGMIVCLFAVALAASCLPRMLGEDSLTVRAGRLAFNSGLAAFVGAALTNGFAANWLLARGTPAALEIQLGVLAALNQTLAMAGTVLVAFALAVWAPAMWRRGPVWRPAALAGLAVAVLAVVWLTAGQGAFGLYPATMAVLAFGAWSVLVSFAWLRGPADADPAGGPQ